MDKNTTSQYAKNIAETQVNIYDGLVTSLTKDGQVLLEQYKAD
jgi:hypothetical protein